MESAQFYPAVSFHLGKPILIMILTALASSAAILHRPPHPKKQLTVWVFDESHHTAYQPLVSEFEQKNHVSVDLQLVQDRAEQVRLQGIFANEQLGTNAPDLAEVEISRVGKFFRPPVDAVGFLPLNALLDQSHLLDQIVKSRFAPWTKAGVIFGIPNDLHPCTITYRDDLFREAGIDLSGAQTWDQFAGLCRRFNAYWLARGCKYRHAMELNGGNSEDIYKMILQRHVDLLDDRNQVHLNSAKIAATVAFVAKAVVGSAAFSGSSSGAEGPFSRDLREGNLCAFITPDWRVSRIKQLGGAELSGKLRMMPMPLFDPDDAPTSTWGGTMMGILRTSPHREEAWQLAMQIYLSPEGQRDRHDKTGILPPTESLWALPVFHEPDPYFGGQKIDELFISLARQLPAHYVTPATNLASLYLNGVYAKARTYVLVHGDQGLEDACQRWLDDAADELKWRMKQWEF